MLLSLENEIIPAELAPRIREIESAINTTPVKLASNIAINRYGRGFWDRTCFLSPPDPITQRAIEEAGLATYDPNFISTKETNLQWLQCLGSFAALGRRSRFLKMATKVFSLDPGIKVKSIEKDLPPELQPCFWYGPGGDKLTDYLLGKEDEKEIRANILGVYVAEIFLQNPHLKLSELASISQDLQDMLKGPRYRTSSYFKIAEENIRPVFGHRVLKKLGTSFPKICQSGLIPLQT